MHQQFVVVVGHDKDGNSSMSIHSVNVSDAQLAMNAHIDMAIFEAEELGYTAPFTTFDNSRHEEILSAALVIKKMRKEGFIPEA